MTATDGREDAKRVQRALLAHLRQEFIAPAAAIVGYTDILIEDARRLSLDAYLSDLERIHSAGHSLHALLQSVLSQEHADDTVIFDQSKLRHDLRTPINAIKGYGEMLVEDAAGGHDILLADLNKLLTAADGMLKRIDALVDFRGDSAEGAGTRPHAGIGGVAEAVRAIRTVGSGPVGANVQGRILIVDDNPSNRELLGRQLMRAGHTITEADGGHAALNKLESETFDLILLDLMMPDISGYAVLCRLKAQPATSEIPVIMISALDDLDSVIRCIEAGAIDYLFKPFDATLLRARIGSSMENKLLRDREKLMVEELRREKARSEDLLLSILPRTIVDRINAGETMIADHAEEVSILFADIVGFTQMAGRHKPSDLVRFLNSVFTAFDELSARFGAEKIKTIGDAYMVVAGLHHPLPDDAERAIKFALEMNRLLDTRPDVPFQMRIGIHSGPVVAGVIGKRKKTYDLWGDTVNTASRMESTGEPGIIHMSEDFANRIRDAYPVVDRGVATIKGKGAMRTYALSTEVTSPVRSPR
jgi:adenylate cyclase